MSPCLSSPPSHPSSIYTPSHISLPPLLHVHSRRTSPSLKPTPYLPILLSSPNIDSLTLLHQLPSLPLPYIAHLMTFLFQLFFFHLHSRILFPTGHVTALELESTPTLSHYPTLQNFNLFKPL